MNTLPKCEKCGSEYTYEDGNLYVCPECSHEWPIQSADQERSEELIVKDAHGNVLEDGDCVTIIKDIKVKGASLPIKVGVKVKNIKIIEPVNGHNIDAKVKGFGGILLKSEFVKKTS